MRRMRALTAWSLVVLAVSGEAGPACPVGLVRAPRCEPAPCPHCSCPCCHRPCWLALCRGGRVRKLIEELRCARTWRRILAARKLGCRVDADCWAYPQVGDALIEALLCDGCSEVRQAAAESIRVQNGGSDAGILALYLASRLDPHPGVRTSAAEALAVLARNRGPSSGPLFLSGDLLVRQLQEVHYRPGSAGCRGQIIDACSGATAAPGPPEPPLARDRPVVLPNPRPPAGPYSPNSQ